MADVQLTKGGFLIKGSHEEFEAIFCALMAMVSDNHSGQDNLDQAGWVAAEALWAEVCRIADERARSPD